MVEKPPKSPTHGVREKNKGRIGFVVVRYVSAPDAEARLSRAIEILICVAEKNHNSASNIESAIEGYVDD